MNGKQVKVGQFAAKLRRKLFQEHLGLLGEPYANVIDPISDDFYKVGSVNIKQCLQKLS